jgi:hypothetical protein
LFLIPPDGSDSAISNQQSADTKLIFQQVKDRRESTKQKDIQELNILEILQDVRRKINQLVVNTQNNLRANELV